MAMEELNLDDLAPVEILVSLKGKKYILKEPSGDAIARWRNSVFRATRLGPEGNPMSLEGMADTEPLLVSLCLFRAEEQQDGSYKPGAAMDMKMIRSWGGRIVAMLSDKCKEMAKLEEFEGEAALSRRIQVLQKRLDFLRKRESEKNSHREEEDPNTMESSMTDGSD